MTGSTPLKVILFMITSSIVLACIASIVGLFMCSKMDSDLSKTICIDVYTILGLICFVMLTLVVVKNALNIRNGNAGEIYDDEFVTTV